MGSDPGYATLDRAPDLNSTHGSGWIVQILPTFLSKERRLDLNNPPTSRWGIPQTSERQRL